MMNAQDVEEALKARGVEHAPGWARVMLSARSGPVPLDRLQAWTGRLAVPECMSAFLVMSKWDTVRLSGGGLAMLAGVEQAELQV